MTPPTSREIDARVAEQVPLANDHNGMKANGTRLLYQNHRGYTGMRKMMADHLREMATRYYSGDIKSVDEFLQLYCFGEAERKAIKATEKKGVPHV